MAVRDLIPSFVGYYPDEAARAAADLGVTVVFHEDTPPRRLPQNTEPRVGRQRVLDENTVEFLLIRVPVLPADATQQAR